MPIFVSFPADSPLSVLDGLEVRGADALVLSAAGGIESVCAMLSASPQAARKVPLHAGVGPFSSGRTEEALRSIMPLHPDAIHLLGCETSADVQKLDVLMSVYEAESGWQESPIPVFAEFGATASAILAPGSYRHRSRRLAGLVWNPAALLDHVGVSATPDGTAGDLARFGRSMALLKAREAEVPAFLTVSDAPDRDATLRQAEADGFSGIVIAAEAPTMA